MIIYSKFFYNSLRNSGIAVKGKEQLTLFKNDLKNYLQLFVSLMIIVQVYQSKEYLLLKIQHSKFNNSIILRKEKSKNVCFKSVT